MFELNFILIEHYSSLDFYLYFFFTWSFEACKRVTTKIFWELRRKLRAYIGYELWMEIELYVIYLLSNYFFGKPR